MFLFAQSICQIWMDLNFGESLFQSFNSFLNQMNKGALLTLRVDFG